MYRRWSPSLTEEKPLILTSLFESTSGVGERTNKLRWYRVLAASEGKIQQEEKASCWQEAGTAAQTLTLPLLRAKKVKSLSRPFKAPGSTELRRDSGQQRVEEAGTPWRSAMGAQTTLFERLDEQQQAQGKQICRQQSKAMCDPVAPRLIQEFDDKSAHLCQAAGRSSATAGRRLPAPTTTVLAGLAHVQKRVGFVVKGRKKHATPMW